MSLVLKRRLSFLQELSSCVIKRLSLNQDRLLVRYSLKLHSHVHSIINFFSFFFELIYFLILVFFFCLFFIIILLCFSFFSLVFLLADLGKMAFDQMGTLELDITCAYEGRRLVFSTRVSHFLQTKLSTLRCSFLGSTDLVVVYCVISVLKPVQRFIII